MSRTLGCTWAAGKWVPKALHPAAGTAGCHSNRCQAAAVLCFIHSSRQYCTRTAATTHQTQSRRRCRCAGCAPGSSSCAGRQTLRVKQMEKRQCGAAGLMCARRWRGGSSDTRAAGAAAAEAAAVAALGLGGGCSLAVPLRHLTGLKACVLQGHRPDGLPRTLTNAHLFQEGRVQVVLAAGGAAERIGRQLDGLALLGGNHCKWQTEQMSMEVSWTVTSTCNSIQGSRQVRRASATAATGSARPHPPPF